jgi:Mn2+/Fe2+ NRAMP family transporter
MQAGTLGEIGLAMAKPLGIVGGYLFAVALFSTCLGAALEVVLAVSYNLAQGFGWEWGQNQNPVQTARYYAFMIVFLLVAVIIGLLGIDPLQLALFASTVIALFLPVSLSPFLFIMNDPAYLKDKTNGWFDNTAIILILLIAFAVAVVSVPLEIITGGG